MNEKRIREVIAIEQQAEDLLSRATREAERMPAEAQAEAQSLIEQAKAEGRAEAQRIIDDPRMVEEASRIIAESQTRMGELERRAQQNMEKALALVLDRVLGRD